MFVIDSETFAEISPIEYNRKFISQKTRSDGRGLLDFRTARVQINAISTANGSSQVRTGKTLVVCGIKAQIASPTVEAPKNGYIVVNVDLPPNCSSKFKPGPPSEMSQTMTDYVNRIISSSGMIDTSQLCIEENTVVWVLHIDVICIKYDGNVFDAVMLAVMTALKSTKLPLVTFNEEDKSVVAAIENTVSIELVKSALSVSFSVFDGYILLTLVFIFLLIPLIKRRLFKLVKYQLFLMTIKVFWGS